MFSVATWVKLARDRDGAKMGPYRNRKREAKNFEKVWSLRTRAFGSYVMYEHLKCRGSKLNQDGGSVVELQR